MHNELLGIQNAYLSCSCNYTNVPSSRNNSEEGLVQILYQKGRLTIWLISVIGIGVIVLSELWGSDEALGVGETPGEPGPFPTLSLEVRLGDSLAGKLRVFVHCDKLRTILTVHKHNTRSLNSLWRATRALANTVRGRMRNRRGQQNVQPVQVATWPGGGASV